MVQKGALKVIYPGCSYDEILKTVKLPTLSARRNDLCKKYFNEIKQGTHKLTLWRLPHNLSGGPR